MFDVLSWPERIGSNGLEQNARRDNMGPFYCYAREAAAPRVAALGVYSLRR